MKASDLARVPVLGYALRWGMDLLKLPVIREHAVADIRSLREEIRAIDSRRAECEERLSLQEERVAIGQEKMAAHQAGLLSYQKSGDVHWTALACQQYWENTLKEPRYADPKRLL